MTRMQVCLVTLGDPATLSGGYLYHRRMAEAAPRNDAFVSFVSFPDIPFPLPAMAGRSVAKRASLSDVVVLDSIAACYASIWVRRVGARAPVVAMLHQTPGGIDHGRARRWITARLDLLAYAGVTRLFVASESLKAAVVELGVAGDDIVVVPPGRDVATGVARAPIDLRASRRIAVLCVGNWVPKKGMLDALEALAALPDEMVTLHLVGDERWGSRYGRSVADRVARPDLNRRVVRHGPVSREEVASLYRSADAFLLPSSMEAYGTAFGEALAEGLPVIGYRAGNLPYLADHEKEGLLAEPGDIGALSQFLARVAEDDDFRLESGRAAKRRAQSFPTWDMTAAAFFAGLRRIVGDHA